MKDEKKHKFGVLKTIGIVIAASLITFSIVCFIKSFRLARPIHKLENAIPIRIKADVSKPGVYSGTIEHSEYEEYAHFGVELYLIHNSEMTFPEIFDSIAGKIETFNEKGEMVTQFELHTESPPHRLGTDDVNGCPPCWILDPFTAEQKIIKITVTKPVEKLADVNQVFEGYYLLNGIEFLPAGIVSIWGLIFLGAGILLILIIIIVPRYKNRKLKKEHIN